MGDMHQDVSALKQRLESLAGANAVETVLVNGFAKLASQLEPLAELAPPRTAWKASEKRWLSDLASHLVLLRSHLERADTSHAAEVAEALHLVAQIQMKIDAVPGS